MRQAFSNIARGESYYEDTHSNLGRVDYIEGVLYQFVKFASGTGKLWRGDALSIDEDETATFSNTTTDGIVDIDVIDATSNDVYALVRVGGAKATKVNLLVSATATADYDQVALVNSTGAVSPAYGSGALGKLKAGTLTQAASGDFAATTATSAELITVLNRIADESQAIAKSNVYGRGNGAIATGLESVDNAFAMATYGATIITGTAAPISADMRVGSILTYDGVSQVVTAIDTGSAGLTAVLATGFGATGQLTATGSGWTATGGALTGFSLGAYQVESTFK